MSVDESLEWKRCSGVGTSVVGLTHSLTHTHTHTPAMEFLMQDTRLAWQRAGQFSPIRIPCMRSLGAGQARIPHSVQNTYTHSICIRILRSTDRPLVAASASNLKQRAGVDRGSQSQATDVPRRIKRGRRAEHRCVASQSFSQSYGETPDDLSLSSGWFSAAAP